MSAANEAAKTWDKKRRNFYTLQYGSTVYRCSTRASTFDGQTWEKANIGHSSIKISALLSMASVTITLPASNTFAKMVRDAADLRQTAVTIARGYEDDPDEEIVPEFIGRIIAVKPLLGTISLICEPGGTKMRRSGSSAIIQRPCRHALYHAGCDLNIADFNVSATATDWTKPVLTVAAAASQPDNYYSGGIVTYGTDMAMIIKHTGSSLKLMSPIAALATEIGSSGSAAVQIAPGCDRRLSTCDTKFSNRLNHGGFPEMTDSPFNGDWIG